MDAEVSRELRNSRRIKPVELAQATPSERSCSPVVSHLWVLDLEQEITSAVTSINATKLPALFKKVKWLSGTRNADIGAGRFTNVSEFLSKEGVENFRFDPFNMLMEENLATIKHIHGGQCHTATVTNTLNVIQCPIARSTIILRAHDALKPGGTLFVQIHEGDKSGLGRISQKAKDGRPLAWQENRRTRDYLREIESLFNMIAIKENIIIATKRSFA